MTEFKEGDHVIASREPSAWKNCRGYVRNSYDDGISGPILALDVYHVEKNDDIDLEPIRTARMEKGNWIEIRASDCDVLWGLRCFCGSPALEDDYLCGKCRG